MTANGLIHPESPVIVGVSGGPDSLALLHLLATALPTEKLVAVYVDHGLRPDETGAEIALVRHLAQRLVVGYEQVAVVVRETARATGASLEETARVLRYQALEKIRQQYQGCAIAVGHTADDQAEEVLIRLIRGSGRNGLAGMQPQNGWIVRPLLNEKKQTLLDYLQSEQIAFCHDSSNDDRAYLRNRVRLDLLPFLEDRFNASIRQTLLQTARILRDEDALLDTLTDQAFALVAGHHYAVPPPHSPPAAPTEPPVLRLNLQTLRDQHPAIQRRILEKCCWQMEARPQFRQIELLLELIHSGQTGAEIHLSQGLRAQKGRQEIIFSYPQGKCSYRGRANQQ
jgi:tRNA(Ile)-lysidine synthase